MKTLGELLPKKQAALLTDSVKAMTKKDIEKESANHTRSNLSYFDVASLKNLAITRINAGQTIYTYSNHTFDKQSEKEQDPSTCSCFIL